MSENKSMLEKTLYTQEDDEIIVKTVDELYNDNLKYIDDEKFQIKIMAVAGRGFKMNKYTVY